MIGFWCLRATSPSTDRPSRGQDLDALLRDFQATLDAKSGDHQAQQAAILSNLARATQDIAKLRTDASAQAERDRQAASAKETTWKEPIERLQGSIEVVEKQLFQVVAMQHDLGRRVSSIAAGLPFARLPVPELPFPAPRDPETPVK